MDKKKEIEEWQSYMGKAKLKGDTLWKYHEIEKTHQAPRCKICNRLFPRLDQGTMICDNCKYNKDKYKDLKEWY